MWRILETTIPCCPSSRSNPRRTLSPASYLSGVIPLYRLTHPSELVTRLRALTISLLPVEADPASINDPTSRIITHQVISAYIAAAGDFVEAVCLSYAIQHQLTRPSCHTVSFVPADILFWKPTIILQTMEKISAGLSRAKFSRDASFIGVLQIGSTQS